MNRPEGAKGDCWLDLNNFENHQIKSKHIQFQILYAVDYNPYAEYLKENPICNHKTILKLSKEKKSNRWVMFDDINLSVYQFIVRETYKIKKGNEQEELDKR